MASKRLDDLIASVSAHDVDQYATNRSAKLQPEQQRQLRLMFSGSADGTDPGDRAAESPAGPAFDQQCAFPASARAMIDPAAIHKDALRERGMPADFPDQLQRSLTKLHDSLTEKGRAPSAWAATERALALDGEN